MIKKLLPVVLLLVGSGAGVGAGMFLRPAPDMAAAKPDSGKDAAHADQEHGTGARQEAGKDDAHGKQPDDHAAKADGHGKDGHGADGHGDKAAEYVKLNNQFVVPVVKQGDVVAMVVMALSIEVPEGGKEAIYKREPKLRDAFLQVMFDHANLGGFDGAFTAAPRLSPLRAALREMGQKHAGRDLVQDVLITEIARQDY